MLLDVDGVLNVIPKGSLEGGILFKKGGYFFPTVHTNRFLRWAWKEFEVLWLTAWFSNANEIAGWAGLPDRTVLCRPSDTGDYKLKAVKRKFAGYAGKVVWVEDGIGAEAEKWVAKRSSFLYVRTEPAVGVTAQHSSVMAEFCGLKSPDWRKYVGT